MEDCNFPNSSKTVLQLYLLARLTALTFDMIDPTPLSRCDIHLFSLLAAELKKKNTFIQ